MSKVNPLVKESKKFDSKERLAGGSGLKAAKQENIGLLRRAVLANLLWENNAYMDGASIAEEIKRLIPLCHAQDVADLAVEARTKQKLRHIPLFIAVEMLQHAAHKMFVADILPKIITRADMITDFLALYEKSNGHLKPLASAAKQGLAKAFNNFNEYQFAKYDRNSGIKLRDAMFLVHPKPEPGKEEIFRRIASRTLHTPDTWEVALSTGKNKKATWTGLIEGGKIGGLAMLRNIANMRAAGVNKKIITQGLETLKSSMLLPLDFLKAARMNPEFSREIEDAMINSYKHLPKLSGRTLFIVDVSGSMGFLTSGGSVFSRLDQACAMVMLAVNQCEDYEIVITAGHDGAGQHKTKHIEYPQKGFGIFDQLTRDRIGGGGIFTRQCLDWCRENLTGGFERIIIFSDSQDCDRVNKIPSPFGKFNYICDVSAHTRGIYFKNVWTAEISGFSENFLTYIAASEGLENKFDN